MEYRRLGRTNLNVSLLGLGTGGPSQLGQKSGVAEADAHRVVHEALDLGINLIDTAAAYGDSERILGRALNGVARDRYVLCTKSSDTIGSGEGVRPRTGQELRASVEESLRRLQTDSIDVFQLHAVLPETYDHAHDELVPVMKDLQGEGKIRYLGITESFAKDPHREVLRRAMADGLFDTILVGYNFLTPGPETDVLPLAEQTDTGVLVMCAVRRRIARPEALADLVASLKLDGAIAANALPDDGPLDWLVTGDVRTVPDAAYRYVAMQEAVDCVLTGTASVDHLRANVAAVEAGPLPLAAVRRLQKVFGPVNRKLGD
ncbi:MAG TPA: aldo/keto reductase [Thermomicrobiales bacterium]|nr:aldo/keto reductase [Thermomicrobiales bacterium]